jgi:hypothetical protein
MSIIPATQEAKIRRLQFEASPGKKTNETSSSPILWAWWYVPVIPGT